VFSDFIRGRWESEYGTNTGLMADVRSGSLLYIAFLELGPSQGPITGTMHFRVRYYD